VYWSVPKFPQLKNKDKKHIKAVVKFALQQKRVGWKTAGIWLLFLVNFLVFLTVELTGHPLEQRHEWRSSHHREWVSS
jgi:hypothetical protein